jgi:phosphopentomutase
MPRAVIIILDGVGVGEMPDAAQYNDQGSNTLSHLAEAVGGLRLPCLEGLGLGRIGDFKGMERAVRPLASWGVMEELSKGKDTITGHWEMMGIVSERPFPTYPDGFPQEIIGEFERKIGRRVLWNRPASGTEIIKELGDEHMRTGSPIVYTSADSVFQIAAHEDVISVEELYGMCKVAREILKPPHDVCRVIARPFIGPPFERTYRRKDFPLPPPGLTLLDLLKERGVKVVSVGKVIDMFAGRGFTEGIKAGGNREIMEKLSGSFASIDEGLVFANLVDFDTLYGHRNDTWGFKKALEEFDSWLSTFVPSLREGDYLFLTADHGNDPTTPSTDHSREHTPLLAAGPRVRADADLGTRESFADVGATIARAFGVGPLPAGRSFLAEIRA